MNVEDQDALRKFNEEWDNAHTSGGNKPPIDLGGKNNSRNLVESINTTNMVKSGPYVPPSIPTTGDRCDQCGTLHPPIKPGDVCPVAGELTQKNTSAKPKPPIPEPTTGTPPNNVQRDFTPVEKPKPAQPIQPVIHQHPTTSVKPEPEPLAENNIPTEIHVNKYLNNWHDIIMTHCKTHSIVNVKRLMRHLTVEVTDFLEHNKGR